MARFEVHASFTWNEGKDHDADHVNGADTLERAKEIAQDIMANPRAYFKDPKTVAYAWVVDPTNDKEYHV